MIGIVAGKILENQDGKVVVAVGSDDSHVGYALLTPRSPNYQSIRVGENRSLFVYTHVRETNLDLYGFTTLLEKEIFLTLLGVSGVGPKVALGALSQASSEELIRAVRDQDKKLLSSLPGVGKKTAERMILELKDKIEKKIEDGVLALPGFVASSADRLGDLKFESEAESEIVAEAKNALVGLGYKESDAKSMLERVLQDHPAEKVETLVKLALQK